MKHKPSKYTSAHQWQEDVTDLLITCQLHSFVMEEQHVVNMFVLQEYNKIPLQLLHVGVTLKVLQLELLCNIAAAEYPQRTL